MASAFDVAAYVLEKTGPVSAMKLQKLVYYSQAWSLVWDDRCIFQATIQAWANGPVIPILYGWHRGEFLIKECPKGNPDRLSDDERETIGAVVGYYGKKSSQWLSDLTHSERPWQEARRGLGPGERGTTPITPAAMAEYYGSLT